jgi:pyruvate kinase
MTAQRKTRILVTLGPSTDAPGVLERLVEAGIDAVRLNLSHGDHEDHARRIAALRALARRAGRHIPVVMDLCGPKIRVGELPAEGLALERGALVELVTGRGPLGAPGGNGRPRIPVPVPGLLGQARRGDTFLLKDGLLRVRVTRPGRDAVAASVEEGGRLYSHQGIALPGAELDLPALTAKDRRDIRFGIEAGADLFALSFVRSAAEVRSAKRLMRGVPIIAKIERREAVADLRAIIGESAGVLVARGDLGVELAPEQVPLLQKHILREANGAGRVTILATQMLASMELCPFPTRAEATDVANAVLDGADGLLLTGETAGGKHPVAATEVLARIVREIESSEEYRRLGTAAPELPRDPEESLARAAIDAARGLELGALVVLSRTGRSTAMLAHGRPAAPIVALAPGLVEARRLALEWGVVPKVRSRRAGRDLRVAAAEARAALGLRATALYGVLHADPKTGDRHFSLIRA